MTKLKEKINIEKLFFQSATKMEAHIVDITPKIAKRLLEQTDSNVQRKINFSQVTHLSREIINGDFCLNGDAIRQDVVGNIIDGQHRLNAVVRANRTIKTIFVKGLPTENIHTIDIGGKARSLADVLEINHQKKYKYANSISAAVKFIYAFNGKTYNTGPSRDMKSYLTSSIFLEWIDNNPTITDFVEDTMRLRANGDKMVTPSIFCGLKWILDRYNKDKSNIFFQQLSDGIGVNRENPIFTLRKKILSTKFVGAGGNRIRLSTKEIVLIILRTWNAFVKGETLTYIYIPKEMPIILHK